MEDGGWSWRRQDGGPPCLTPLLLLLFVCFGFFVFFFFLHSLLSIKKPFLQPASEAHSLPLSINDVPPSPPTHQKEPCAFSESGVGVLGHGYLEDTGSGLCFVEQLETFFGGVMLLSFWILIPRSKN